MKSRLQDELKRLEQLNIITKVDQLTEWIPSFVINQKPSGKLRVYNTYMYVIILYNV